MEISPARRGTFFTGVAESREKSKSPPFGFFSFVHSHTHKTALARVRFFFVTVYSTRVDAGGLLTRTKLLEEGKSEERERKKFLFSDHSCVRKTVKIFFLSLGFVIILQMLPYSFPPFFSSYCLAYPLYFRLLSSFSPLEDI